MRVKVPRIKEFPSDGRIWRIEWFGAVERTPAEARIEVLLTRGKLGIQRPRKAKEHFEAASWRAWIGVGQLPFLAIGSLFRDGRCLGISSGDEFSLPEVIIGPESVRVINAGMKFAEGRWAVPPFALKLEGDLRLSKCLAIAHDGDPYAILLPAAEAIRFYYAVSTDLAHITFGGSLNLSPSDVYDASQTGLLRDRNRMVVKLRQWLADDDGWIIGRSLADPVSNAGIARVYDSLLQSSANYQPAYPECSLPFEGATRWEARGLILPGLAPGSRRWLIYELLRCSAAFPFDELEVMRDNDARQPLEGTDMPEQDKRPGWATGVGRSKLSGEEPLQSEDAPNAGITATHITLAGQRFGALAGKEIQKTLKEQCRYRSSSFVRATEVDSLATGDPNAGEQAVGHVKATLDGAESQRRTALPASFEVLEQLVLALNEISGVEARIRSAATGISFLPLTKPSRLAQWSYLDFSEKSLRQVMIVDIRCNGRAGSLVEFQLRPMEYCVAALLCSSTEILPSNSLIASLLGKLVRVRGVWSKVSPNNDRDLWIRPYKHTRPSAEAFAAAIYALLN